MNRRTRRTLQEGGDDSRKGLDVGKCRICSGHGEWNQFIQRRGLDESGHVLAY